MSGTTLGIFIVIIAYITGMVAIGVWFSKKNNDVSDFYLGGRKLGPLVTAMSAEASDMSSWLLMGLPGLAYLSGIADPGWTAIGLAVGTYFNWLIVAKRLRRYSAVAGNAITIPDFFSNRYRDKSHTLLGISALIIVIFFIPYTASGFAACGKLFSNLFGVSYIPAMLISAVVIVGYTALGGFLAASATDFIQSIVMTLALIIVVCFGVSTAGGLDAVMENAKGLSGYLSMTSVHDAASNTAGNYGIISIVSTFAWGLGYFGMPHILLRFMAIEDENKLKLSRRVASIWVVISMAVAIFIGIVGYSMSVSGALDTLSGTDSETLIIKIAQLLSSHGALSVIFAGIILAGILACTMSTADSQLLAASSSISQNILKDVLHLKLSEKMTMLTARLTVVIIAVIAVFIAKDPDSSVFGIVSFAWAGFGGAFGPVMLFSLFWRRTTRNGALAGMICGGAMVFIWKYLVRPIGGAWDVYELLPAFLAASLCIIVVSLMSRMPEREILDEFDSI
ncbi:MAG: sodium/proline symporter [Eubacterium sp.]|jgi:sodium/proline symporter|nr:sodium/proline symporter [Eubacterium sp.]